MSIEALLASMYEMKHVLQVKPMRHAAQMLGTAFQTSPVASKILLVPLDMQAVRYLH